MLVCGYIHYPERTRCLENLGHQSSETWFFSSWKYDQLMKYGGLFCSEVLCHYKLYQTALNSVLCIKFYISLIRYHMRLKFAERLGFMHVR